MITRLMCGEPQNTLENPSRFTEGMNDDELEMLASCTPWNEKGLAPWATWESENSSFGRTIREWTGYPSMLPIFVCSDHGVGMRSVLGDNERTNKYKIHLTWNIHKHKALEKVSEITPIYVQHPWVSYRKKHYSRRTVDSAREKRGTLVFFPHSNPQSELVLDYDRFFGRLRALPRKFHPIVLCLMSHDIKKGLHKTLRRYAFPIVTAGNTNSQFFVDRFYKTVCAYKYIATVDIGSHVFYALEAGLPVFLTGDEINRVVVADWGEYKKGDTLGIRRFSEDDQSRVNEVMRKLDTPSTIGVCATRDQIGLAEYYMGVCAETTDKDMKKILWVALLRNKKAVFLLWFRALGARVKLILKTFR